MTLLIWLLWWIIWSQYTSQNIHQKKRFLWYNLKKEEKMKKTLIIILAFSLSLFAILNLIPLGTKNIELSNTDIKIAVPKLSYLYKKDDNEIILKTLRGKKSIKRELEKIKRKCKTKKCNNNLVYYDEKNNITIINYKIYKKGLINLFSITFQPEEISNNNCEKIINIKKTNLKLIECSNNGCYQNNRYKLKTKNHIDYFLYYDLKKDLLLKTGMEKYNYLSSILEYKWLYREDLIEFMDYQVSIDKNTTKEKNQNYNIYYNKDFMLIDCQNKNIYVTNPTSLDKTFCTN